MKWRFRNFSRFKLTLMLRSQEFKMKRLRQKVEDVKSELCRIKEIAPVEPAFARRRVDALGSKVFELEHDIRMFKHELENPED